MKSRGLTVILSLFLLTVTMCPLFAQPILRTFPEEIEIFEDQMMETHWIGIYLRNSGDEELQWTVMPIVVAAPDGIPAIQSWFLPVSFMGSVPPGAVRLFRARIETEWLLEGNYLVEAQFSTNVRREDASIHVTFQWGDPVQPFEGPHLNGLPEEIDFNPVFELLLLDSTYTLPFAVVNNGSEDLLIEGMEFSSDNFTTAFESVVLGPEESAELEFDFHSDTSGLFEETFTFFSNDERNEGEISFPIRAMIEGNRAPTDHEALRPGVLRLSPPYPNPFNSTTRIGFDLSAASASSALNIAIFDPLGRRIADLIPPGTAGLPAGSHSVIWNASGVPAGQYLIRLEAGEQHIERTIILTK
jgi:hypothetical protein